MDSSTTSTRSTQGTAVPYLLRFSFETYSREGDLIEKYEKYDDDVKVDDLEVLPKDEVNVDDEFPEGGRGWFVVFGVSILAKRAHGFLLFTPLP